MRYYGKSDDEVHMTYVSNDPDIGIDIYTKETDSNGFLDTRLSEWLPYKGTFVHYTGVIYKDSFISEYAYKDYNLTEGVGIPAELVKEYDEGIETNIYVRHETTKEKIAVKEIILIGLMR